MKSRIAEEEQQEEEEEEEEKEEKEEKEEGLFKAGAVNEEDPERDRATPEEENLFIANAVTEKVLTITSVFYSSVLLFPSPSASSALGVLLVHCVSFE